MPRSDARRSISGMRVAWLAGVLALATATLALAGGFAKGPTLRVGVNPLRAGTVTSSPKGIRCEPSCDLKTRKNAKVTLTAHPARGYRFRRWGFACTGTRPSCTVKMSSLEAARGGVPEEAATAPASASSSTSASPAATTAASTRAAAGLHSRSDQGHLDRLVDRLDLQHHRLGHVRGHHSEREHVPLHRDLRRQRLRLQRAADRLGRRRAGPGRAQPVERQRLLRSTSRRRTAARPSSTTTSRCGRWTATACRAAGRPSAGC